MLEMISKVEYDASSFDYVHLVLYPTILYLMLSSYLKVEMVDVSKYLATLAKVESYEKCYGKNG